MQNRSEFIYPDQLWMFPVNDLAIKVPKCTKYGMKACNIFRYLVKRPIVYFSFRYMC